MAFSAHGNKEDIVEHFADENTLHSQSKELAKLIKNADYFVVFTGAGVSTSAGIPDFRGPQGVWTLKAQGKQPENVKSTTKAYPTLTHMSLVALEMAGNLKFLISQNTDGLHRRSGFPPEKLAELHGNSNVEICRKCKREYFRDFKCRARGSKVHDHETGRKCICGAPLYDTIINFGEHLSEKPMEDGFEECKKADLCLVLGSSLRVTPAADMPSKTVENDGKLVVCNLQKTPLDDDCDLRIFAKTDDLMGKVMNELKIAIPDWCLIRHVNVEVEQIDDKNLRIKILGIESDGIPASLFTKIKIKTDEIDNYSVLKSELFSHDVKFEEFPIKVIVKLYFMGNYNEPDCRLKATFSGDKKSEIFRYKLSFNPKESEWKIAKI